MKGQKQHGTAEMPGSVSPEVLVLERLKDMTKIIRTSRNQPPAVAEVAARFEQRFDQELAEAVKKQAA
jgi:hypothetical protein